MTIANNRGDARLISQLVSRSNIVILILIILVTLPITAAELSPIRLNTENVLKVEIYAPENIYALENPEKYTTFQPKSVGEHRIKLYYSEQVQELFLNIKNEQLDTPAQIELGDTLPINILDFNELINPQIIIRDGSKQYSKVAQSSTEKFLPPALGEYTISLKVGEIEIATKTVRVVEKEQMQIASASIGEEELSYYEKNGPIKSILQVFTEKDLRTKINTEQLSTNKKYEAEIQLQNPYYSKIKFKNFKATPSGNIIVSKIKTPKELSGRVASTIALEFQNTDFEEFIITKEALGTEVYLCDSWNSGGCEGNYSKILDVTPGVEYSITIQGNASIVELGVATINSKKAVYHTNELAQIYSAVLDNQGFLVPNANVSMEIIAPNNQKYYLNTTNDSIEEQTRGIYLAEFTKTTIEGNYQLKVTAIANNTNSTMTSFFKVSDNEPFEIIRNTPLSIDPWKGSYETELKVISNLNITEFEITERIPLGYNITNAGGAIISQTELGTELTWNINNNSVVKYSVQAPLITPFVDEFRSAIEYSNGTYDEARPWFLAIDPLLDDSQSIDVSITALDNTTYVVAYIDITSDDASFQIISTYLGGTILVAETDVNTDVNTDARIDVTAINDSYFAINVYDSSGDNNDYQIYDRNGTEIMSRVQIDASAGTQVDTAIEELGDRVAFVWNDPASGDNVHGDVRDHEGNTLSGGTFVVDDDANHNEMSVLEDHVDIAALTANRFVAVWFDDNGDTIRAEIFDGAGNSQTAEEVVEATAGATAQVASTGLRNNYFVVAYYDSILEDIIFSIYDATGDAFGVVASQTTVDASAGTVSRLDVTEIKNDAESYFAIVWFDSGENIYEGAVYDSNGNEITAPFTIETNPDDVYRLLAVEGHNSLLDLGLCNGTFVTAYTNSSNEAVFKQYLVNGSEWNGFCGADIILPTIELNNPANSGIVNNQNVSLQFTPYDDQSVTLTCSVQLNGNNIVTDSVINNDTLTTVSYNLADGTHFWNVTCQDLIGNINTSETYTFVSKQPYQLVKSVEASDVAITSLSLTKYVVAYTDLNQNHASFQIWDVNGSLLVAETDIDLTIDSDSRVDVEVINNSAFMIAVTDGPDDDLDFLVYDINGTELVSSTEVDSAIGLEADVKLCQLGNRTVIVNANGADDDADYRIYENNGNNLVGESSPNTDIDPNQPLYNIVDCAVINKDLWLYTYIDASGDGGTSDLSYSLRDSNGNNIIGNTDLDPDVSVNAQVASTGLRNNRTAIAWYDGTDQDISIFVGEYTGTFNSILAQTDIDTDSGTISRLSIAEITISGNSNFVVVWQDQTSADIKAAVYDMDGNLFTPPFTITTNEDATYQLIDVTGYNSLLSTGLCEGTFAIAYVNSSNEITAEGWYQTGLPWDGACVADTQPPNIQLNAPTSNPLSIQFNQTFDWTVTDDRDTNLLCDLVVDNQIKVYDISSLNGTSTTYSVPVPDGNHTWYINCTDNFDNTNQSTIGIFSIDVAYGNVSITEANDVSITSLDNTTIVIAYIDNGESQAEFQVWDTNGTLLVPETEIDISTTAASRISVSAINKTDFSISVIDAATSSLTIYGYNIDGTQIISPTIIDSNVGTNNDVSICQLGNRFITTYANDNDNDADFQIYSNLGVQITGETNVDGNIDPGATSQNLVECAAISSTRWAYAFFDDSENDLSIAIRSETGAQIIAATDYDTDIGETGQVASVGLRNGYFATAFYDSTDEDITISILELDGTDTINTILADTDVSTNAGTDSRISIAEIISGGTSNFVVAWQDQALGDIKAVVYDSNGIEVTPPFTLTTNEDATYQLIDVVGFNSRINTGLCEGTFALAFTNSTNQLTYLTFLQEGIPWDGVCTPDTTLPTIELNYPNNAQLFTTSNITFNWTANDNLDTNLECSLIIDGITISTGLLSDAAVPTTTYELIGDGNHTWRVDCADNAGNTNSSISRNFSINVATGFVDNNNASDVSITALDNTTVVIGWIDNGNDQASFEVWDTNGTLLVPEVDVDIDVDTISRVTLAPINTSAFVFGYVDGPNDNYILYYYRRDGTLITGPVTVETSVGDFTDVQVCQLGDRIVATYADQGEADADFLIYDNNGNTLATEAAVDGNIAPGASSQNLIDCSAISSTSWVYTFFDDSENDLSVAVRSETGAQIIAATDIDTDIGETGQVASTGLRNNRFVLAWFDSTSNAIKYTVRELVGTSLNTILAETDIDTNAGIDSRISIAEIENNGASNFIIAWQDTDSSAIKGAVFDADGTTVTPEFTITTNQDATHQLIDVVGFYNTLDFGLCEGTFAISYVNNTNNLVLETYGQSGTPWNGICVADTTSPIINLTSPINNELISNQNISFEWTPTDNRDLILSCDIVVDNIIRASGILSPNGSTINYSILLGDGNYTGYVSCSDDAGNNNQSNSINFSVDQPTGLVDNSGGGDVSILGLDNQTIIIAWIDAESQHASFQVWDTNGTLLVPEIDIDVTADISSRVSLAPINRTAFIIGFIDGQPGNDELDFFIYNTNGTQLVGKTIIDANIGNFNDVEVCQLSNRWAVTYANGNDLDNDLQFWSNNGANLVGETTIDGNMGPNVEGENLVACAAINNTRVVLARFDDAGGTGDDISFTVTDQSGNIIITDFDVSTNAGPNAQVALTPLQNNRFAIAYHDDLNQNITLSIYDLTGDVITPIITGQTVDGNIGLTSRISMSQLDKGINIGTFVITWKDNSTGRINSAVYDNAGNRLYSPYLTSASVSSEYKNLDVTGYFSHLDIGLCEGTFATVFTNSSNEIQFKTFYEDGGAWNGICVLDTSAPNVTLNNPLNDSIITSNLVTFNWTGYDNLDLDLRCDLYVDGVLRINDVSSPIGGWVNRTLGITNGLHSWNVTCADNRDNTNSSQTWYFTVNSASDFNDVNLPYAGDWGIVVYSNESNQGTVVQRNWTGTLEDAVTLAPNFGVNISWQRFVCSATRPECYVVSQLVDNSLHFARFDLQTRTYDNNTILDANTGLDDQRGFDIACEDDGVSVECLVVFEVSTAADSSFAYVVWNGEDLGNLETYTVNSAINADFRWLELYPQKDTNIIGLMTQNDAGTRDIIGMIWRGENNTFGNEQILDTEGGGVNNRQFDCAWEGLSETLFCAYGKNIDDLFAYRYTPNTETWTNLGNIYDSLAAQAREIELCGETPYTDDFTHNYVGLITCDQDADRDGSVWNGNALEKFAVADIPSQDTASECGGSEGNPELFSQSCSFEKSGKEIVFVWTDQNENSPEYGTYKLAGAEWSFTDWGAGIPIGLDGLDDVGQIVTKANPARDEIFLVDQDFDFDSSCALWTGRAFVNDTCGDFETTGPSNSVGSYIDFDWINFKSSPIVEIVVPRLDFTNYNYTGITNPSNYYIAHDGLVVNLPPNSTESPIFGTEASNTDYLNLRSADNNYYSTTVTTTTGDRAYQSYTFEVNKNVEDILNIKLFHEGYATGQTFQIPDVFYFYVYNFTSNNYTMLRTSRAHDNDIFTEITISKGFSDIINDGNLYVLLEGSHTTGIGGNARADLNTDYIALNVTAIPSLSGNETVTVHAVDDNGINNCSYHFEIGNNPETLSQNMQEISSSVFTNTTHVNSLSQTYHNISADCRDSYNATKNDKLLVRIDYTNPFIELVSPFDGSASSYNNQTFKWNGTDNSNGRLICNFYLDSVLTRSIIGLDSNSETNISLNVTDGYHQWYVTCFDAARNSYTSTTWDITIDTGPPTITLVSPLSGSVSNQVNRILTYTPTDANSIVSCELLVNGIINQTDLTISNGIPNAFTLNNLANNVYNWSVNCTDNSAYEGNSSVWNFTVDTQSPNVTLNVPSGYTFTGGLATLNYTATDNIDPLISCNITVNSVISDSLIQSPNGTLVSRNLSMSDGYKEWYVSCVDDAKNAFISETRNFTVIGPPFIELQNPLNNSVVAGDEINFNYSVTDGNGISACNLYFDGLLNLSNTTTLNNPGTNIFTMYNIEQGQHNWSVSCNDTLGDMGYSATWQMYVDNSAPNITNLAPLDGITLDNSLVYFNFTVIDNFDISMICNITIDGNIPLSQTNFVANNGSITQRSSTIPNGLHYWNVTCIDDVGNSFIGNTWSFTVNQTFPLNVDVNSDKYVYQSGEIIYVSTNISNQSGSGIIANSTLDIIYTNSSENTSIPWWNNNWYRRIPLTITELTGTDRINDQIRINLSGLYPYIQSCSNEIRIINYETGELKETPRNILSGDDNNSCEFSFEINISANQVAANQYAVYFNNTNAIIPSNSFIHEGLQVQRGIIISAGATVSDTLLTPINPEKTFIIFSQATGSSAPDQYQIRSNFSDNNTITFDKYDGSTESNITWQTISHPTDIEVIRGYHEFGAVENSANITISEIDISNSFILIDGSTSSGSSGAANQGYFEAYFINNTAFSLRRATTGSTANVSYQVVSWKGAKVQNGTFTLTTTSSTRTINSFNTSRSFLVQTWAVNGDDSIDTNQLRSRISSSTAVTFSRTNDAPTSSVYVSYYLVELPVGYQVQTNSLTLSTPFSDVTINSVNLSNAFNFHTIQSSGGGTTYTNAMSISNLTSSTNLRINKETGSNTNIATWFVIEDTDYTPHTVSSGDTHLWIQRQINQTNSDGDLLTILNSSIYTPGNYSVVSLASTAVDVPNSGADNFRIILDEFGPEITLLSPINPTTYIPPVDLLFAFTANDLGSYINNCSLILNGEINQTNSSIIENQLSNFTISDAEEGRYEWAIQCYDGIGNNATSDSWVVFVDATAPWVTASQPNGTAYYSNDLIFNYTAYDNLDEILSCNVSVDSGLYWTQANATNGTLTSTLVTGIPDGIHFWNVTCTDDAEFSSTSNTLNFTIDALPVVSLDTPEDNYGSNITNITFRYYLIENNLVNCSLLIDGSINQTANASNVSYQNNENANNFTVSDFEQGIYSWNVQCIDINGFVGSGIQRILHIDSSAPNISIYEPENNTIIYVDTIDFVFNASDNVDDVLSCNLYINDELNETNVNANNGVNTTVTIDDFIAGYYNWSVTCFDNSNYSVSSVSYYFNVSNEVRITLNSPLNDSADGDGNIDFSFTPASLAGFESGGYCDLYIDGLYNQTNITITNAAVNHFYTFDTAEGVHTWYVNCTDDSLTNGVSQTYTVTVDLTPPTVNLHFPDGDILNYSDVEFNWTATDNVANQLSCDINIDGILVATGITAQNGTPTQQVVNGIDDGLHDYNITCYDTGGLSTTSATNNFIVQELPYITLNTPANNFRTNITTINFSYTPTDNSLALTSCEFILNGSVNTTDFTINHGVANLFSVGVFENGIYNWNVNCTDGDSNQNTSVVRTIIFDLLGPNIDLVNPGEGAFVNNEDINFTFNATDNFATAVTCDLYLDEVLNVSLIPATSGSNTLTEIKGLDTGPHNWTVICWDDLQNYATSVFGNFTVNSPDFVTTNGNLTVSNNNPDLGENLTIYLNVTNIGGATAAPTVEFWDGPRFIGNFIGNSTISLVVNQSALFNTTWIITEGYRGIYAYIDPEQLLFELNETNNNASKNISALNAQILIPLNNSLIGTSPFPINFTSNDYTNTSMNYSLFVNGLIQISGSKNDNESISVNFNGIEGRNAIYVRVNDSLGRIKNSPIIYVYLDTTPPLIEYNTANNTWFNTSIFNVSFNVSDAIDFMIDYDIFVNQIYNRTNNASNNSVVNESFTLPDGIYNITTQVFDDANNTQNYTITIYVDTTNPNVTLIDPAESANLFVTNITFNYTATDNLDELLACELFVDSAIQDSYNLANGSIRSTWVAGLFEGNHNWNVTCVDEATNIGVSQTRNFSIFIAPSINLTSPQSGFLSNVQTQTLYFNVSDDTGLTNCSLLLNGAINSTKAGTALINSAENNFTINNLAGYNEWAVQCYDNTTQQVYGVSSTWNFTIDITPPTPIINTLNETWYNYPPIINFTITDDFTSNIRYVLYVNSTYNVNGTVLNNTWSTDSLVNIPNGTHTVIVQGTDDANNSANSTGITIYVDTVPSTVILYNPSQGQNVTNNLVKFNFTIIDNLSPNMTYYFYIDDVLRNSSVELNNTLINQTFILTSGPHTWFVNGTDLAGNIFTSEIINFSVVPPDLTITSGNITFNNTNPIENSNITVIANITNIGDVLAGSFNVQFWYGDPEAGGVQIGADFAVNNLSSGQSIQLNITYVVPIGNNNFFVLVDTPLNTNGSIEEENETNNQANNTLTVGLWQYVYGSEVDNLVITDGIDISVYEWITSGSTGGNIYATDSESSLSFTNLTPLTRDTSNGLRFEDLSELDIAIGAQNLSDNINRTYSIQGILRQTTNFNVFNNSLNFVPVVNSTNNTNFLTGILWDANDGNTTYNGSQDVAFISEISKNTLGYNGTVDFEIRVPALLRDLYTVDTAVVYLYTEII